MNRLRTMSRSRKIVLGILITLLVTTGLAVAVGSFRHTHIITVTRTTTADPNVMWHLWEDVPNRTDWDHGLDYIKLDDEFREGAAGTVKVDGQDPLDYEIIDVDPGIGFTDRFYSFAGTYTDWHHTINERPDGRHDVTWRLEASGPLSLISTPALKSIFGDEVPAAVDEFVELAEKRTAEED